MSLNVNLVRRQYPVFQNQETAEWAFFENAGGSFVPEQVIQKLYDFFRFYKVQPYGLYPASIKAGEAMNDGYRCIAELLNAEVSEITLGPSTTLNLYVLAQALRPGLNVGDEIIVTNQDHEANIGCWQRLSEFGIVVKEWRIDSESGELNIQELKTLVTERTRLVCFTLCSNIVGTLNDVGEVTKIAHDVGALVIADGVSFAPHQIIDVNTLGVDFYLFRNQKTIGTHIGVMWGKKAVLETLKYQGHFFNSDKPNYRLNPAGPLHAEIAALAGIGEYYDILYENHFDKQHSNRHERAARLFNLFVDHESRLANQLLDALRALPEVKMIGQRHATPGKRAATISFIPRNRKPSDIVKQLAKRKIAVRNGHFYALRCIEALGIADPEEGVVRISLVHYNTEDEVDRLSEELKSLLLSVFR